MATGVIISKKAFDFIIGFEVGSETLYNKKYIHPVVPGEESGITIGIGYDLGQVSAVQIKKDWKGYVSDNDLALLMKGSGLKKNAAKQKVTEMKNVTVSFHDAVEVFINTLEKYAINALKVYPGLDQLFYDAQGAIISLVYNRGTLIDNSDRRKEMKELIDCIAKKDYEKIAFQIRSMKRLWNINKSRGLILRREDEAILVEKSNRLYTEEEKMII